jgi:PAS domain S-box-containing protein
MRYKLRELIDVRRLEDIININTRITKVPVGIIDMNGDILIASGWQDICEKFHRVNPGTSVRCWQNQNFLMSNLKEGQYTQSMCKNGLWDIAMPIMLDNEIVAILILGQFFYKNEVPEREYFLKQAEEFGFIVNDYLEALGKIPVFEREEIREILSFYSGFVSMISEMALANKKHYEAEEKIRQNEGRFKALIENSSDIIAVFDEMLMIKFMSPSSEKLLGYKLEDVLDRDIFSIIHPDDRAVGVEAFKIIIKDPGSILKINLRVMHKNGTWRYIEGLGRNLIKDPAICGIVVNARDVTERKLMEDALRQSREFLENIFECIQDGISILDKDLNIIKVNRTMEKWYSHNLPFTGKKCFQAYQNSDRPCENCPSCRAIEQKSMQMSIVPYTNEMGVSGWIELYSFPFYDVSGNVTGVIEHVRDITDRKNAMEALRESEEKFRALAETSPAAIILYQGEKIIYANSMAEKFTGYQQNEILDKEFWFWVHPEYREIVKGRGLARRRGESLPRQYEIKYVKKSGETAWAIINGGTIMFKDDPIGIVIAFDNTERKAAEDIIKSSLLEKELLLKEVHHRVKNNMQIISSMLNLQINNTSDSRIVNMYKDSCNRIRSMSLIHEKLYMSSNLALVDFEDYLRSLTSYLAVSLKKDGIGISITSDKIYMDIDTAITCGLIVNELVSNSLKYAYPDNRRGTISIDFYGSKGDSVILIISDDGVGIPANIDIFNAPTLGLQLVTSLVDQLNGSLELVREKGTRFVIKFNLRINKQKASKEQEYTIRKISEEN